MLRRISTSLPTCSLHGTINYISGKFNVGLPDISFYIMVRDFASYVSDSLDDILPDESRLSICKELEIAAAEEILAFYGYRVVSPYLVGWDLGDYTTEQLVKEIQTDEYDHLSGLNDFLADLRS